MHFVQAKGLLSPKNGMNIYRGCTHGCIYCDSRSLCYGFDHPFEDIEVKENAPELLERALKSKRRRCMISTGSMCDPYLHCERELGLTRRCLEIIDRYGFGLSILTKSDLIMRDIDLLESINRKAKCVVQMTMTTLDEKLCAILEPNVCSTRRRHEVLCEMRARGIPTVVWLCPVLPYINDTAENISGILDLCADAGVYGIIHFGIGMTLRDGDREYYYAALDRHFPGLKQKYISRYGTAYELPCENWRELEALLERRCAEEGILCDADRLFAYLAHLPERHEQLSFLDDFSE